MPFSSPTHSIGKPVGRGEGSLKTRSFSVDRRRNAQREREFAKIVVEESPVILYRAVASEGFRIAYVSKNIVRFGYSVADVLAGRVRYPDYIHEQDRAAVSRALRRVRQSGSDFCALEYRVVAADGSIRWIHDHTIAIRDESARLIALQGTFRDITERKAQEERVAALLAHDPLTGLINRTSFSTHITQAITDLRRSGLGFAVHLLGLDHFKDINDTLGHEAGDTLMRLVADRLETVLRTADVVARIGGDEFAILQTNLNDASASGMVALRLLEVVARPVDLEGHDLRVTASVGIVVCKHVADDSSAILRNADIALHRAKDQGRAIFRIHNDAIDHVVRERVTLHEELRRALEHDQLLLYYQPQVDVRDGRICGIEALVRWQHPTRGLLLPGTFIRIAEITGLIVPLGVWVLREGARQMRAWMDEGLMSLKTSISVNLSPIQFQGGTIESDVLTALDDFRLPPDRLELELTESDFMAIHAEGENVLGRLQERGLRIAIDDFGTGYSSLAYVKRLRGMRLKIAQEFIRDLPADEINSAVVRAIVGMAREIGIEFIAEGVETQEQVDFLRHLGCDEMQGFMFSHPLSAAEMSALLGRNATARSSIEAGDTKRRSLAAVVSSDFRDWILDLDQNRAAIIPYG